MKFSVCCTTPSRRARFAAVVLTALFAKVLSAAPLQQPASSVPEPVPQAASQSAAPTTIEDFVRSNTLQMEGKTPFHLQMSFQIFSPSGRPAEQGTLEYWWAASAGSHLDVTAPSFGTLHSVHLDEMKDDAAARSLYLAMELLDDMRAPASMLASLTGPLVTQKRESGKLKLACVSAPASASAQSGLGVCTDEMSSTIRLVTTPMFALTRNRPGLFSGTHVALDLALLWGGQEAITGHVDKLESFKPETSAVTLTRPSTPDAPETSAEPRVHLPGKVIAGYKLSGAGLVYPRGARTDVVQGTVLLFARISQKGEIVQLFPMTSPDQRLTQAAMDAVKTWKYRPYLLNGSPVEVSTIITTNFGLR